MTLVSRVFTTLGQLAASLAMTRLGRRIIFSLSGALTGLGLIAFGLSFYFHPLSREPFSDNQSQLDEVKVFSPALDWLPAVFLSFTCFSYCLGLGGVPWAYSNELLPPDVRALVYSVTSCLVPLENFLMTKILPSVMTLLSVPGTLYMFGTFSLLSVLWGVLVLPETRGLTSQVCRGLLVSLTNLNISRK